MNSERTSPLFWIAAASALVTFIGCFGPWASAFDVVSESGVGGGDGILVIVALVVSAVLLFLWLQGGGRGLLIAPFILGALCVLIALIDLVDVLTEDLVDLGWGLVLTFLGSIAFTISSFLLWMSAPRAAPQGLQQQAGAQPGGQQPPAFGAPGQQPPPAPGQPAGAPGTPPGQPAPPPQQPQAPAQPTAPQQIPQPQQPTAPHQTFRPGGQPTAPHRVPPEQAPQDQPPPEQQPPEQPDR